MLNLRRRFAILLSLLVLATTASMVTGQEKHFYKDGDDTYAYDFTQTGDNYSFVFDKKPGGQSKQLRAVQAVFQAVYEDASIKPVHVKAFMKEGAECFVFDASFYSYTACLLPNDFSPDSRDRFWGFVSRLPNAAWLMTRNLLPALLALGTFLVFAFRKKS